MKLSEYIQYDALGLAALLKEKSVSPEALMNCAIELAMKIDPKIHALCYADFDGARARAKTAEVKGVFGAVPFLLKDSA
ncbi:amidase, partial [Burkholderia thailandensis]|nr:amidase [Burkholderia thailandensis]